MDFIFQLKNIFNGNSVDSVGMNLNGENIISSLPDEVLTKILSYVDIKSLLGCRRVCVYWKMVIDTYVWKSKLKLKHQLSLQDMIRVNNVVTSWTVCYKLHKNLNKNLIKNPCGKEKLKYWVIQSSHGNQWVIENPPVGSDPLPTELTQTLPKSHLHFCYASSYGNCSKKQLIEFSKEGFSPEVMDQLQPTIMIRDWYAGRFDCGCIYKLRVDLLDENKVEVLSFNHEIRIEQWLGKEWHKVEHAFKNYGPGIRFIAFYHEGNDTQFWAGNYGSKMTGSSVILTLNSLAVL